MRPELPIQEVRAGLRKALSKAPNFILSAPAGSGKSTQVPQYLLDDLGDRIQGEIWVLQPRRLPARMLANRVAWERGEKLGQSVGYQIRFDNRRSAQTRILYLTEALLLRRLQQDPLLKGIGAILFDEFHERHIDGDIALSLCRRLQQQKRPDLILGVMSATLNIEQVRGFLPDAAWLESGSRSYPVDIHYHASGDKPAWEVAAQAFRKAADQFDGDCLIFMPGAWEIRQTMEAISNLKEASGFQILPLHGELPAEAQDAAVNPGTRRKVIVSTNVAETSLTIDGAQLVIDSGLARTPVYDVNRGINTLLVQPISQASADQRAGRAGRTGPGIAYRLWSEKDHWRRDANTKPEITRLDLSETVLTLCCLGVDALAEFDWLQAPPPAHLDKAVALLEDLGALRLHDPQRLTCKLSPTGRRMADFPLHPRYARILLEGARRNCLPSICIAVALTQVRDVVMPLHEKGQARKRDELLLDADAEQSDLIYSMRGWLLAKREKFAMGFCRQWGLHRQAAVEADRIAAQLMQVARSAGLETEQGETDGATIRRCLLHGFADHLARRRSRATLACDLVHGRRGEIRRHSVVHDAELLISSQIEEREHRGDVTVFLGQNSAIEVDWLREDFPEDFSERTETILEPGGRRIIARRLQQFRDLVIEFEETGQPDPDRAAAILAEGVMDGTFVLKQWNEAVENWIRRVNCLARHFPEYEIAAIDDEARKTIIEQICFGAISYKEIKDRPVRSYLEEWLSPAELPLVDRFTPERFEFPSGSRVKLRYEADGRVVLAAVLQQLYDVPGKMLRIGDGRIPLRIEILAPSRRPVQITDDLDAFWTTSYPAVRKDLRGRYPKHEWR
ncbi:MAG: ATP-dependent helicase HrpB [Opitutales bacterium]|nr:ATP-dependent helicase HrpB [Opitutales bacterium]